MGELMGKKIEEKVYWKDLATVAAICLVAGIIIGGLIIALDPLQLNKSELKEPKLKFNESLLPLATFKEPTEEPTCLEFAKGFTEPEKAGLFIFARNNYPELDKLACINDGIAIYCNIYDKYSSLCRCWSDEPCAKNYGVEE